jgi:hypothetical protein
LENHRGDLETRTWGAHPAAILAIPFERDLDIFWRAACM